MLGLLLPGVREVRAALAAGTLLLLSAYLLLYEPADTVVAGDRVSPALRSLYDTLGRGGLLVAAAVAAYVVGAVVMRAVTRRLRLFHAAFVDRVADPGYLDAPRKPWPTHLLSPLSRPAMRRVRSLCEQRGVQFEAVLADIVLSGGKRLLGTNRDLYGDYDRLLSEGELRLAVSGPSVLLAVAVALQVPAPWPVEAGGVALTVLMAAALVSDALSSLRDAYSMYAHLVTDGVVATPTLDAGPARPGATPPPADED
ncbi:MAG TPA: hypothetical protein VIL36_01660 [Acidimicrobiales bacterium]